MSSSSTNILILGGEGHNELFDGMGECFNFWPRSGEKEFLSILDQIDQGLYDVVVFCGGEDINPDLYGDITHHTTHPGYARDSVEVAIYNRCTHRDKYRYKRYGGAVKVGICRGAQLLCAMNGGRLIQDVRGHTSSHSMSYRLSPDEEFLSGMRVSSLHHQMMYPWSSDKEFEILAYAEPRLSNNHYKVGDDSNLTPECELEVIRFPYTRSICHQGHPEFMDINSPYVRYFQQTVIDTINMRPDVR
jgi:hypothetical protein